MVPSHIKAGTWPDSFEPTVLLLTFYLCVHFMNVFTHMAHVYTCGNAYGGLTLMPVSTLIAFHISFEIEYVTSLASLAGKRHPNNPHLYRPVLGLQICALMPSWSCVCWGSVLRAVCAWQVLHPPS